MISVLSIPTGEYHPTQTPSIELPNQVAEYVSHIALDIGGSLIKLIYFSPDPSEGSSSGSSLSMQDTATCSPTFSAASPGRPVVGSRVTGGGAPLSHVENSSTQCPGSGLHEGAGLGEGREGHNISGAGRLNETETGARANQSRVSTDGVYSGSGGGLVGGNGRGGGWGLPECRFLLQVSSRLHRRLRSTPKADTTLGRRFWFLWVKAIHSKHALLASYSSTLLAAESPTAASL